jgi:hypothetical protein
MLVVNFFTVVLTSIKDAIFVAESYIVKNSSGMVTRHRFGKKKNEVYLATLSGICLDRLRNAMNNFK